MATATIENNVPAVYKGIAGVLNSLAVEKNGILPGNMGGKNYITAGDISNEVKRQFVANNLIILPDETILTTEAIQQGNRIVIRVVVQGTYHIVSTVDGSQATITGSGDGLATGTAVASNIASTNALKNALLRTFLITEQSVEEASLNGVGEAKPAPAAVRAATAPKRAERKTSDSPLKDRVVDEYIKTGIITSQKATEMFQATGLKGEEAYAAVLAKLEKGEVD